jgi:hypothetical protein
LKFISHLLTKPETNQRSQIKAIRNRRSDLLNDYIQIALVCGTIGIAPKFIPFFDQWVYFPTFPNLLDSTFIIISVIYLGWQ